MVRQKVQHKAVCRLAAVLALACGHCGREPPKANRYVPAPELCRAAREAVLVDWKEGRPPEPVDRLPVTVNVVDQLRKPGQILEDFEILGEAPSTTGRGLIVRLKYDDPAGEETVRYVVVGIDPLWVFRQEDLDLMSHWDHPMPPAPPDRSETEGDVTQIPKDDPTSEESTRNADEDRVLDGQ
jgi:hypothetical protein